MRKLVIFGALLCSNCASAQDSMSLQQVIAYGLAHNSEMLRTQYEADLQDLNVTRSEAGALPSINGLANNNYNFGRTVDPTTNQFVTQRSRSNYFSLNAEITLFDGLQRINTIRQARRAKDAGEYTLQKKKEDISLNIANQYLQVLLLDERISQLKNLAENSRMNRDRTQTLVKSGAQAESKLLEAEALLAGDEANLIDIQNQQEKALLALKQYINFDVSKPLHIEHIPIKAPSQEYSEADLNKAITEHVPQMPGVLGASSSRESALYALRSAIGNASPKLTAGASLSTAYSTNYKDYLYTPNGFRPIGFVQSDSTPVVAQSYSATASKIPFSSQLKNNFGQSIGFSLQIPIFNGLQNRYNIQNARINLNNATQVLADAQNQARNDIYQAYASMQMAAKKWQASNLRLQSQEALFHQVSTSYNLGATSFYDWTAAQNNLSNAQSDALQSKYEYVFQVKVFEYYLGKPVEF